MNLARAIPALVLGLCASPLPGADPLQAAPGPLPGAALLEIPGDLASNLVAGVDRFLLRKLEESVDQRARFWRRDFASPAAYNASVQTNRARLAHILGLRDPRPARPDLHLLRNPDVESTPAGTGILTASRVRWTALEGVHGEGLLLELSGFSTAPTLAQRYALRLQEMRVSDPNTVVIAIPDADQTPEQLAGLEPGTPPEAQFARLLAQAGCRVIIPALVSRKSGTPKTPDGNRGAFLSQREFLYRPAFALGRHLLGYELQKILALVDWCHSKEGPPPQAGAPHRVTIGVLGWGEGGLLALYAGALDPRIDVIGVSGYFDRREVVWQEPLERNVFGLLERFGDAELASLIAPRPLLIEAARGPEIVIPAGTGAAPAALRTPDPESVRHEFERARTLIAGFPVQPDWRLVLSGDGTGAPGSSELLEAFQKHMGRKLPQTTNQTSRPPDFPAEAATRERRQVAEINAHTQRLLADSPRIRQQFMSNLDPSSPAAYERSAAPYRELFDRDVIGRFDDPLLPLNPRARRTLDAPTWTGYEVVLDVWPDVIAYGLLLLPKNLADGERRPVVVCQHGLEGRPQDLIHGDHPAYHDYAARLADRGFITFAPQNLYLFGDRFRTLQRKANPLGKTLFSLIVPQHRQLLAWLKSLPFVDPERIAFYGLSYGGKTAMRVPALVPEYCLSICSADFNEWVWKNASTLSPYSYVWTGEYEIFEFDLGSTFNYAEMAALIAPRPFMVERGHFDGVAPDETVAYEFAKVRHLYAARLRLPERCAIEWFVGPHTIHGQGTFDFLHRHLRWPQP